MKDNKTNRLTFRLSSKDAQMLRNKAIARGLTPSAFIRRLTVDKLNSDREIENLLFNKTRNFDRQN